LSGQKKKSNLVQRALTGTVYVAVIVSSIYYGGWYLHILFGVLALLMLQEFTALFKKSEFAPNFILAPIVGLFIYLSFLYVVVPSVANDKGLIYLPILIVSILGFAWIAIAELFRKKKHPFVNIGISVSGIIYIVLPLMLINIMSITSSSKEDGQLFPLLGIFIMIWTSDTFAYLVGRKLGKRKLFERISPNKSWEGFIGGLLFSVLAGVIIAYFLTNQPYIEYAILGFLVAVFGTLGDLIESMLKRSLHLKDSGKILPGHGGLLDRLDSVLIVIPIIYVYQLIMFYYFN
jgi:phosphatidate cytidylyltransferase